MPRKALNDEVWEQLLSILKRHGCQNRKNNRNVMEAIIWKLRTGSPWRDIPSDFCPWQTAYTRFSRWASKGLWKGFFLKYEEKLIRNGYSSTEAMLGLISMQVELGVATNEQLALLGEDQQQRFG